MRKYLIIFIVFFPMIGFSQEASKSTPAKWTIGPAFSFILFDNIKAQTGLDHKYKYDKSSFPFGFDLEYHISRRSVISTGLLYYRTSYEVVYVWAFQQPGDPLIPRQSFISADYFDIPAIYNFSFIAKDKFEIYTATGIVSSILVSSKDSTVYQDNSVRNSDFLNNYIPSFQFGVGFQLKIKNTYIEIEPQYRIYLKGLDTMMYQHPTAFSAIISLTSKIDWKCFFKKGAWRPLPTCD